MPAHWGAKSNNHMNPVTPLTPSPPKMAMAGSSICKIQYYKGWQDMYPSEVGEATGNREGWRVWQTGKYQPPLGQPFVSCHGGCSMATSSSV